MTAWHGKMIAPDSDFAGAPQLRTETKLDDGHGVVESAVLRVSAHGVVEAWVNGNRASDEVLTPGWTSYEWRLRYAEHDVTALVAADRAESDLVLGLALGNGWYRGRLGWTGRDRLYGDELAAIAELKIRFTDGHEQVVATDSSWMAGPSPTTANDLYNGQDIDARLRDDAWLRPGFASAQWVGVHEVDADPALLEPYIGPGVRRIEEVVPQRVWTSPAGRVLVDFGQNLVGWVRARVRGASGETVTIRHAEVLEHDELGVRPLRTAAATDRFTLSGGEDEFEPTFTFHGFRYAEVEGWPGGADALRESGALTAVVVHSDVRRTGHFASSNEMLDRLHGNVVWGMRGNFLDVPTDCPQRDERLGWTGDIAAFASTAVFLYDVKDFLADWLRDLALEQEHHDGIVPMVVPDAIKLFMEPDDVFPQMDSTAIWSDAAVWVPWSMWMAYGDRTVLEQQWNSMTAHARRVASQLSDAGVWESGFQLGDWLDPSAPPEAPHLGKADAHVVATLCAYRTMTLVAQSAAVLGDTAAEQEFLAAAERIRVGFAASYITDGRIHSDAVTVYALAIVFGILNPSDRAVAGERLVELVREAGHRISTGFAGTPFVTDALTEAGHLDDAYRLLLQTECPSWLYPVTMGATTVWERWDSMLSDGTINPGEMTSFNHYALGAVADWMHRTVGGLSPLEPGYRRFVVAPRPGGGLDRAAVSLDTCYGSAAVSWRIVDGAFHAEVTVPEGAEAVLHLPGASEEIVTAGTHRRVVALAS